MVRVRPERFPQGIAKKLQARSVGPFKILKRVGSNAYVLELPSDMGISSTFNVEDLIPYKGSVVYPSSPNDSIQPSLPFSTSEFSLPTPHSPPKIVHKDVVEDIVDEQVVSTRQGGYQKFLIKWKNRPNSDNTWVTKEELQRIDPDILERYYSFISPESSFSQPRRIDEDISANTFKVYRRKKFKKQQLNTFASLWL
ncbi:hypothetical protein ACP275_03G087200 [Erythranthe tilingii]